MAIQKEKTLRAGVSGNYWRINRVGVNLSVPAATFPVTFQIACYVDKASSDAGKPPIYSGKSYTFPFTRTEILSGTLLSLGYTRIKEKANTMVEPPFGMGPDLIPFDSDLNDGEDVL